MTGTTGRGARRDDATVRPSAPARRPVTGRALVLGAVVVFLVVLLAAPLHRYLAARSGAQQAAQQKLQSEQQLRQLQQLDGQLSDPAYIAQQARIRLQYAMPGDTVYVVVQPGQQDDLNQTAKGTTAPTKAPGNTWNKRLWGSVQAADHGS